MIVGDGTGQPSFAVLPGLRQASKSRLGERIATLPGRIMDRVDAALAVYLSDRPAVTQLLASPIRRRETARIRSTDPVSL